MLRTFLKVLELKNGLLTFQVQDRSIEAAIMNEIETSKKKHGGFLRCDISQPYKQRTLPENAKWWSMCSEFARYCGSTKEEVAMGVKCRAVEEGLWKEEKIPFTDKTMPVSTTESNTKEMSILIDVLYRIAAEFGYVFAE